MVMVNDKFLKIIEIASRAPTAHNIQPVKWHISSDGQVDIYADERKKIYAADPSGWSFKLSIGTSIEGLALGASHEGFKLSDVDYVNETIPGDLYQGAYKHIGKAQLIEQANCVDPLVRFIKDRHSYRGIFSPFKAEISTEKLQALDNLLIISDKKIIEKTAELHLLATYEDMKHFAYSEELYHWIQFYPRSGTYKKTGFNSNTLYLNRLEQIFAPIVMNPYAYKVLSFLGLGKIIISQTDADKSASHLAIILADKNTNPYECGRIFYRMWLEIAAAGFYACPISTVVDYPPTYQKFMENISIPENKMVVDLMKMGIVDDKNKVVQSLRLNPKDYII